ncbi:MAG: hypothetical protein A2020_04550 [Lentisphaerae bacterium GWF2_45_14]|nr:MAG: hypothetical protein A2020_04550 [Lentisphaerae bacterium GWF2_45_14]
MNKETEKYIKSESEQRFMDALLKEHFSADSSDDAPKIQNIISKLRAAKKSHHPRGDRRNRIHFFKVFLSAAALLVLTAGSVFYIKIYGKTGEAEDKNTMTPFLLVAEGGKVIDEKNNKQNITNAKRLSSEENIKVADTGSAFVIFPDFTKIEAAAESQLYFKELKSAALPAWKKNPAAERDIFFNSGIFRIESNSRSVLLKNDYGKILSGNSKIILMVTSEMCYVEVCRGTVYFSTNNSAESSIKITQGKCLIIKPGQKPVILKKNGLPAMESDRNAIASYKNLLIDDKSYDNILITLINKNAVDICLNKTFLRNMMRDLR